MRPLSCLGHNRPLTWVTFGRDGDILFSAGKDGILMAWWTDTGKAIGSYDCAKGVVWSFDVTLDTARLVAASADQKVYIFDVLSGERLYEIPEDGPVKFVEWNRKPGHQNRFVLVHDAFGQQSTKAISVWEITDDGTPQRLWIQDDYSGKCVQVHWGPLDKTIISCHDTGEIYVWDAITGTYIRDFKAHKACVTCLSFTEDRLLMLSSSTAGNAKLWDTVQFECLKEYVTDRPLNANNISQRWNKTGDEQRCHILLGGGQAAEDVTTTCAGEGKFRALIYHMVHCEEIGSCKGHFGPINTLAWMPNGNGYASGGEEGYLRIYHFDEDYFTQKFE